MDHDPLPACGRKKRQTEVIFFCTGIALLYGFGGFLIWGVRDRGFDWFFGTTAGCVTQLLVVLCLVASVLIDGYFEVPDISNRLRVCKVLAETVAYVLSVHAVVFGCAGIIAL